ncbi:hypothetical protein HHK36_029981 [Tetracentron sinense]|uniref:Uncharacterized protein n=1 Tax=Tetracentron sinense TaxID=13715 RepID=A0A834YES4_TETSI|nr:hypothetical protein HHK36_029981 [Tetracentron sinense]
MREKRNPVAMPMKSPFKTISELANTADVMNEVQESLTEVVDASIVDYEIEKLAFIKLSDEEVIYILKRIRQQLQIFSWCWVVGSTLWEVYAIFELGAICICVYNVYKVVRARKVSMLLALAMLFPFILLLGGVLAWDYLSPSDIMGNYPHLVIVGTGFAFGFQVGRMILAHLCDEPRGLKTGMCMPLLCLPFAIANALTAKLNDGVPLVDESWVLLGYCLFTVALYLHLATSVIHEIGTALGIYCFSWQAKKGKGFGEFELRRKMGDSLERWGSGVAAGLESEELCMEIDPPFKENVATAEDWRNALSKVVPAVVVLKTTACRAFDTEPAGASSATGFVVDKRRGIILTTRQVVKPERKKCFETQEYLLLSEDHKAHLLLYEVHDFGFFGYDPGAIQFLSYEEIPLAPEAACVGLEIRVVGNDSGEKVFILHW